jgi:hypothetical protein
MENYARTRNPFDLIPDPKKKPRIEEPTKVDVSGDVKDVIVPPPEVMEIEDGESEKEVELPPVEEELEFMNEVNEWDQM